MQEINGVRYAVAGGDIAAVQRKIESSRAIRDRMRLGVTVMVVRDSVAELEEYAKKQPPGPAQGWPKGTKWTDVAAFYDPATKTLIISSSNKVRHGSSDKTLHEIGHAIEDITGIQGLLHELRALGCAIAVDDFGTGFSTFAYLRQLEADYLKIDGSIIQGLPDDPLDRTVIAALTSIAEIAGKRTIAEWVEDPKMLVALYECGVDYAQGYAVAHPRLQLMPRAAAPRTKAMASSMADRGGMRKSTALPCTLAMTIDEDEFWKAFDMIDIITSPAASPSA